MTSTATRTYSLGNIKFNDSSISIIKCNALTDTTYWLLGVKATQLTPNL